METQLTAELLERLRDGDQRSFDKLYSAYSSHITAHLLTLLKSRELAQEVAQDTFIDLWVNREAIDPEKSIKSYLFKIATNKTYNLFKRAAHDKKLREHMLPILEEGHNNIDAYIQAKENQEFLTSLLEKMPEKQREVYRLFKIEGYSYQEISDNLGISHSTINTHISRANQFLKTTIRDNPEILIALLIMNHPFLLN